MAYRSSFLRPMGTRTLCLTGWIFCLTISAVRAEVHQLHLSWQNDPATTMTMVWATAQNQTPPQVQYGPTLSYGNVASGFDTEHGVILHTVELTGLEPDTLYRYRVSDDNGAWSETMTFRTAPPAGQSGTDGLVVTVSGDKGPHSDAREINARIAEQNADLHLIVGDLAYSSMEDHRYHAWLDQQEIYAKSAPLMPAWGNHDTTENDPPYSYGQAHFALPTRATADERYYSYRVGNAHFVAIDTNTDRSTAPESNQYTWIMSDLSAAASDPNIQWIIVYLHHNIYSAGGKYSDTALPLRQNLQPLFDRYGVDLVLQGHNHYYSRSMPVAEKAAIKDDHQNLDGSEHYDFSQKNHGQIYLTVGGGGKPLYPCPATRPPFLIRCDSAYSFVRLKINGSRLTAEAFRSDGTLLDDGLILTKDPTREGEGKERSEAAPSVKGEEKLITSTFEPTDDATVYEVFPMRNYNPINRLEVDRREEGGQKEAYLKFEVSGLSGPVVASALQLTTSDIPFADSDSTGLPYLVSDVAWSEETITWEKRPARLALPVPKNEPTAIGRQQRHLFDLSAIVSGNGSYSFAIASDSTNGVTYHGRESDNGKPLLIVTWRDEAPHTLP